jgi:hypothetical protein
VRQEAMTLAQCELWTIRYLTMLAEKLLLTDHVVRTQPIYVVMSQSAMLADRAERIARYAIEGMEEALRATCLRQDIEAMQRTLANFSPAMRLPGRAPQGTDLQALFAAVQGLAP